jgi:ubiquinone/menaquinone biosynthesis C-methylase UbiE
MFNNRASNKKSQPDKVLSELGLKEGEKVAEIGSGGGYFALRFASTVGPGGHIYCIDVNPNFLSFISDSAKKVGLSNVETIDASQMYDKLPQGGIDMVYLRSVYHHLEDRTGYFRKVASLLSPRGRVAVIDYLPQAKMFFGPPPGHRTAPETIISEMQAAGYEVLAKHDFLETQCFVIFGLKKV